MRYKFLDHTADLKFQAYGKMLNEVFENSALAITGTLYEKKVKQSKKLKIKAKGRDLEALMLKFLEELLFIYETRGFILGKIKVKISKNEKNLEADLLGEEIKGKTARHYIKAVTYNEMFVKKIKGKFVAQVV